MSQLRTILVWLYCVSVVLTGASSRGYVLCRTVDGAVNIEAVGADGRCAHPVDSDAAAALTATNGPSGILDDGCRDQLLGEPAVVTTAERLTAPEPRLLEPPTPARLRLQLIDLLRPLRCGPPPETRAASFPTSASHVRDTVILLV